MLWRLFGPRNKKTNKYIQLKLLVRKVLELSKTKHAFGINIAIVLIFFALFQNSIDLTKANENITEPTHLVFETNLSTETTFRMPVKGYISQNYNWYHPGIDIAGNENCEISPISKGKVVKIQYSRFGYGISVLVDHGNNVVTRYAHMKAVNVKLGQEVEKTSILGYVGSTGWSTGPHLHLEIYESGNAINPMTVLPENYSPNYVDMKASVPDRALVAFASQKVEEAEMTKAQEGTISAAVYTEIVEDYIEPQAYVNIATNSAEISF